MYVLNFVYLIILLTLFVTIIDNQLWRVNESTFNFRVSHKQFVGLEDENGGSKLVATSDIPTNMETFQIVRNGGDPSRIRIRAPNGLFLQVLWPYLLITRS